MIHCFGCSFTRYFWPSWADLLFPTRPAVNWGIPGLGNRAMFTRVWQAIVEGEITRQDQVIIQWSSPLRYDLKREGRWLQNGNVWNQELNPAAKNFLSNWWDDQDAELQTATWITAMKTLLETCQIDHLYMYMQEPVLHGPQADEQGRPRQAILHSGNWSRRLPPILLPVWDKWIAESRKRRPPILWPNNPFNPKVTEYTDMHPEPREAGEYITEFLADRLELKDWEREEIRARARESQEQLQAFCDQEGKHPFEYYRYRKDQLCFQPANYKRNWVQTQI